NQTALNLPEKNKPIVLTAEAGGSLEFETGSRILVPANAFVDEAGNPIKGEVELNFQEFHSAAEIIASGVKMTYDSAGKSYSFESGGMFKLNAKTPDKEVFLAPNKCIQVELVSHKEGNYNFYTLKPTPPSQAYHAPFMSQARAQEMPLVNEHNWVLVAKNQPPNINRLRQQKLDSLDALLPQAPGEPLAFQENDLAFDFDLDLKDFPELQAFEGIVWVYDQENDRQEEDPNEQQWVFEEEWTSIQLESIAEQTLRYRLKLANNGQRFETTIRPALSGNALKKAREEFSRKKADYDKILAQEKEQLAKIEAKKSLIKSQGNFIRSFEIQEINVYYNWDKVYGGESILATFQIEELPGQSPAIVYMLQNNLALEVSNNRQLNRPGTISVNPRQYCKFIAILPNQKVAVLRSEDFKKLYQEGVKEMLLPLTLVKDKINSVQSLQTLINQI
ncbi:MAG: hypothetical protein AAFU64_13765, partial [Bacteroidota bacterium]